MNTTNLYIYILMHTHTHTHAHTCALIKQPEHTPLHYPADTQPE